MYLYLVKQDPRYVFDSYDSFIVAAESFDEAINTHPSGVGTLQFYPDGSKRNTNYAWPFDVDDIQCTLIGVASPEIKAGILCSSFNAG